MHLTKPVKLTIFEETTNIFRKTEGFGKRTLDGMDEMVEGPWIWG